MESPGGREGSFYYGVQLYPSDAYDGAHAFSHPHEDWFLQSLWKLETKQGRKFKNINEPQFTKGRFVSLKAENMPGAGSGFWRHSTKENSNYKSVYSNDLTLMGISKSGLKPTGITSANKPLSVNLDALFGDKPSGKLPVVKPNFDQPFRKVYENMLGYDQIAPGYAGVNNVGMGVRSKYVGPDETLEKSPDNSDAAKQGWCKFGMNKRQKQKKFQTKHK